MKNTVSRKAILTFTLCAVFAGTTSLSSPSYAENAKETGGDNVQELLNSLKSQREAIDQQRQELQSQQRAFENQVRKLNVLEQQIKNVTGVKIPAATTANAAPKTEGTVEVGQSRKQDNKKAPDIAALVDQGGVLLPKGTLVLEPSIEYSNSSATRVGINGLTIIPALNIGSFELTEVNRDTITKRFTARYGITNRLEVDITAPFLFRNDQTKTRPFGVESSSETLTEVDGSGLGDIEIGAHYQLTNGQGKWPHLVANVRFKSTTGEGPFDIPIDPATGFQESLPTGSGFYAIQPSITAIFPTDPVVFFGNFGYLFNMKDDISGRGEIDPGDSISASLGMGLSLNEKTSFSLSYSHNTVLETTQDGRTLAGSSVLQVGSMTFGAAYKINDDMSLNFTTNMGVTEDAPDVSLLFRLPMTFNLLK